MHVPLGYDARFTNASTSHTIYADTLLELDYQVGAIIDALSHYNLHHNTLVIYTSDNGPWGSKCEYAGSMGPFTCQWQQRAAPSGGGGGSCAKFTNWEAGHRVPFLAHWPGRIASGVSDALVSGLDVFPTLAALAGVPLPSDGRVYDGMDVSGVLFGGRGGGGGDKVAPPAQGHEYLLHPQEDGQLTAIRFGSLKAYWTTR
jgi:arylsulfatase A-like enzyme